MLPSENSLTYFNDLVQHYREVDRRIANAPFKPKPPKPQFRPVEPPPPPPEPELPNALEAAFAELSEELTAAILAPHPCTRIINEVCLEHGITREELISPRRTLHVARIRQFAMWRCRQAGVSTPEIGRWFGNRDHTTVLHAVRKIEAEMREEEAS